MKILILFFLLLIVSSYGFSQQSHSISIDSIAVWEVRKLAHPLALDSNQRKYVLGITKNHLKEVDKIKREYPNDSTRILAIRESKKKLKVQLKAVLTKDQFDNYKALQNANKDAFIQRQTVRKTKVKSLDNIE